MAKRAYYTIQTVISEMLNDEACYPDRTNSAADPRVGLDDGMGYLGCGPWKIVTNDNNTTKFLYVFKDKLSLYQDGNPTENNKQKFSTQDGMDWVITDFAFNSAATTGGSVQILVDVNGKDAPNCGGDGYSYVGEFGTGTDSACAGRANGYDRFKVTVLGNGQVTINPADVWAVNAVKVNRNITSDKNSNDED